MLQVLLLNYINIAGLLALQYIILQTLNDVMLPTTYNKRPL